MTPNKLLTRLPAFLTQVKAKKNSYKLKNEIRKITMKKKNYNNGKKYDCDRRSKNV